MIVLKPVERDDYRFLYELLQERPDNCRISHSEVPTYNIHCKFWDEEPYQTCYIIYYMGKEAGLLYKSHQDEIGIFIKKEYQKMGIAKNVIPTLHNIGKRNLANIAPGNDKSIKLFKSLGYSLIQGTYELKKETPGKD